MERYKVTVKRKTNLNEKILPGMDVEIVSKHVNPFNAPDDMQAIADAFKNKYGVELTKSQIINTMRVEKES